MPFRVFFLFFLLHSFFPGYMYAQWEEPSVGDTNGQILQSYSDEIPEKPKKITAKKKKKEKDYNGFDKLKEEFKLLCLYLDEDGRREWLFKQLSKNRLSKPGCEFCKPFFKTFYSSCRPPRKKKRKKVDKKANEASSGKSAEKPSDDKKQEELEDKPPVPQREPRLRVIDQTGRIFNRLYADTPNIDKIYRAVEYLLNILNDEKDKDPAAKEYYSTLATYIFYPFKKHVEEKERKKLEQEKLDRERKRRQQFLGDDFDSWE